MCIKVKTAASITLVALIMALAMGSATAGTISGASGLITIATADSLSPRVAELALREYRDHLAVTAMYGIMPDAEVGVHMPLADHDLDELGLVMKGIVAHETSSTPGIAIGFETGQSYIVASKRLAPRLRFHGAYLHGDVQGPAVGLAYTLSTSTVSRSAVPAPMTTLLAEYTPNGVNVGARMIFGTLFSVDVALLDMERPTGGVALQIVF